MWAKLDAKLSWAPSCTRQDITLPLGGWRRLKPAAAPISLPTSKQPGLLAALQDLVESATRGDPEAALLWVSKSQRHLSAALAARGYTAGQKLVGRLLRRLGFSLQTNRKTREGTNHPDRKATRQMELLFRLRPSLMLLTANLRIIQQIHTLARRYKKILR